MRLRIPSEQSLFPSRLFCQSAVFALTIQSNHDEPIVAASRISIPFVVKE